MSAAGGVLLAGATMLPSAAYAAPAPGPKTKARICVLFSGTPQPADRNWGADDGQVGEIRKHLAAAEQRLGNIELVIGTSHNAEETTALLEQAGPDAPVLAINTENFALTRVVDPVLQSGRAMLVFALPASGHDWMYAPRWRRAGHRVAMMTTSDYSQVERALSLLRVVPLLKQSRILLFPPAQGTTPAKSPEEVKKRLGADVVVIEDQVFDELITQADEDLVQAEIEAWTKGAKEILEPTRDDILKAARVSVALDQLIANEQADALAIGSCMGWLERGFPCLGFTRLRDRGIPASCEGDMDSLITMLVFQHAINRPGFQGNATFDTSRNALWTAHCTAPLKMDGPDGEAAPYLLRGHSEVGGSGCVPEVQYRLGETVTRTKLVNLSTILA
jgi:hypothetical protein